MKQRGYLMLEVTVGGAMCAVILAGMLVFVASGRVQNVAASREIVANQLVNEALEQQRATISGTVAASTTTTTVTAAGGTYTRTVAVSASSSESHPNPGGGSTISIAFTDVTVTVSFHIDDAGQTRTRTSTGSMRVYQ